MSMESLRRGAQSNRSGGGSRGSRRNTYYARWKPPQMADALRPFLAAPPNPEAILNVAEPVVLIPGHYVDVYERDDKGNPTNPVGEAFRFRAHNFPIFLPPQKPGQRGIHTFREIVCAAGPEPHAPQPCVGCYQVDHGAKDSKPRDQWAFNIAHLAWYHSHPIIDQQTGQYRLKKNSSEPLLVKDECMSYKKENDILMRAAARKIPNVRQPRTCEQCGQGEQVNVWGDHRVLQVGRKHLDNLFEVDVELGKKCVNCGTHILLKYFNCGNEACNARLVDVELQLRNWTTEQIQRFSDQPMACQYCGRTEKLYPEYLCGFDEMYQPIPGSGCDESVEPRKMTIFDCVIWVQREGQATESEIVIKKVESFTEFKTPDNRPLADHLHEIIRQPFDLADMYKPESLDEQAETIRIANPYAVQGQAFQPYGQQQPPYRAPQTETSFNPGTTVINGRPDWSK